MSVVFVEFYHALSCFISVIRRGAVAVYQLTSASKNRDISGYANPPAMLVGVNYARGPDNHPQGALYFKGTRNSYVLIPNNGCLDVRNSITIIFWLFAEGLGPLVHFNPYGSGVQISLVSPFRLSARFVPRSGKWVNAVNANITPRRWYYVATTFDHTTGVVSIFVNNALLTQRRIGPFRFGLATNKPVVIGGKPGSRRSFRGKISCVQVYNYPMNLLQIRSKEKLCFRAGILSQFPMLNRY